MSKLANVKLLALPDSETPVPDELFEVVLEKLKVPPATEFETLMPMPVEF